VVIFWTLAWQEARRQTRQRVVQVAVGTMVILAMLSAAIGHRDFKTRLDQYQHLVQQQVRNQIVPGTGRLHGDQLEPSLRALRPPTATAILVQGREQAAPEFWDFGPSGVVAPAAGEPQGDLGGTHLDLEWNIRLLGGLLALLMGVETIAGARARGTLCMMRSLPLSPWLLLVGRIAGCAIVLATAVATVSAAAATATALGVGTLDATVHIWSTVLRMAPLAIVYLGVLLTAGVLVATLCAHEATAYVSAVVLWLVVALVGPHLVAFASQFAGPASTRAAMESDRLETFADDVRAGEEALGNVVAQARQRNIPDDGYRPDLEQLWQRHAQLARTHAEALDRPWRDARARGQRTGLWGSVLCPGSLLLNGLADAAGTGLATEQAWDAAVETHQRTLQDQLFDDVPRVTMRVPSAQGWELLPFVRHPGRHLVDLARFVPPSNPSPNRWRAFAVPMCALLAYLVAVFVAAGIVFARQST
jgi:hypothetical protein